GILKYSFGRTPTKGFLSSQQPDDIANPWQKGGTGRFIGQIKSIKGKSLIFETRDALHVGDRLRAQPKSDMAGQAWTVREMVVNRKKCMEASAGSMVEVDTPFSFSVGDSIYKVSSREAYTLSDNACQRRLEGGEGENIQPCRLTVSLENERLCISASVSGYQHEFSFQLGPLEPARSGDMQAVLTGQFSKCGGTPFTLESLSAPDFPAVLIPSALFKDLRRRFYQQLLEASSSVFREQLASARKGALKELELIRTAAGRPSPRETLAVVIAELKEWRFPLQNGADATLLPLSKATIHQLGSAVPRMRGSEESIIWQIPFILFDRDIPLYRDTLRSLYGAGFRRFEAANLSHFELFRGLEGLQISTWHRCFSLNSQALAAWHEFGATSATLYLEDDSANIADLLGVGVDIERRVMAYSPLPVMTTKIRIKDVHANTPLRSDRGETYRVTSQDGLQTISSSLPFSLTSRHGDLRQKGCSSFVIDLSEEPRERWGEIIAAFKSGRQLAGTTEFNYGAELI
ncbi:MAG TPA: U32 family peptidase, partial [Desulfuromonadales bacterium]|nr:U32 family peptidase [Desulfuromonadales bacterium]